MQFLKKLLKMLFGVFGEPAKNNLKKKIDEKTEKTNSEFVKKRNELEKQIIDCVDENAIDSILDFVETKTKKK